MASLVVKNIHNKTKKQKTCVTMALNYVPNEVSILGSVVETNWEGLCDNLQRKNPQFDLF